ncbi:RING finger protein [Ceratobasidium sp. AG-Ba]|nr:RING finger protein [Ceratobasidium sp. AG-Ba]
MEPDEVLRTSVTEEHKAVYQRFCDIKFRQALNAERNMSWCRAPRCSSGQIHIGGVGCSMVVCHACSARSCFMHDTVWHEGMTCKQFDKELKKKHPNRTKEIKANSTWLNKHTQPCPGEGCGRWIQKDDGCDHMTCGSAAGCGQQL